MWRSPMMLMSKTLIFKDFSGRFTGFIGSHENHLKFLSEIAPCFSNGIDVRLLVK